ncbi:MAG TPA: hypothetical protein VGW76_07305 [Pyrinomonadaceae bacterium]|nr:hypothetical protein [Pyrinomonadaceae bacterium]
MKETEASHSLLDAIASLSSRGESGRLQITAKTTRGAFFFKQGKLVDARMGPFTGLPAVNLAVSIGETQLSFDPSIQPPISSFTEPQGRTLLKARFGIEALGPEETGLQTGTAIAEEYIRESTPQGSSLKSTSPGDAASVPTNEAAEEINKQNAAVVKEFPSFGKTSRFSTQDQAVASIFPPPPSPEIPAVVSLPLRPSVKGSLKQNSREDFVLSAFVVFLIVVAGAVAADSYLIKGNLTRPLDAQRPTAESSLTPPSIHDPGKSMPAAKAVSAERQPPLNHAAGRISIQDAKTGQSEVREQIIKESTNADSDNQTVRVEPLDKPSSRTIQVVVQIENGHVTEAFVPNPQVGLAAYEATALRIARERRYPKDTSRKQSLTLKVTGN